ncbi:hypothetical protein LOZ80_29545 [Paenibacillus sp. HWE-109]|uniref:hypothetical protein n=1 Tax=Paenibacillus sp. HWE-109 TaxID=1306526 RepID=UPI001EDD1986|nr:hypothetical protein [Paenibacillus sp. HWE-109]UKS25668.1 hypothetical protein LOZ80_29545 [Paenibacillus sp. HWE-109]
MKKEKIVISLLVSPLILFIVILSGGNYWSSYKLKHTVPTQNIVIKSMTDSSHIFPLDLEFINTDNLVSFDKESKTIQIVLKLKSEKFLQNLEYRFSRNNESEVPSNYVREIRRYYEFPKVLSDYTTIGDRIILLGYWGDNLIYEGKYILDSKSKYYVRENDSIKLSSINDEWYLKGNLATVFLRKSTKSGNYEIQ